MKIHFYYFILFMSFAFSGCARQEYDIPPEVLHIMTLTDNPSSVKHLHLIGDSLTRYSDGFYLKSILGSSIRLTYKAVPGMDFPGWTSQMDTALSEIFDPEETAILVVLGTNDGLYYNQNEFTENAHEFHTALRLRTQSFVWYAGVPRTQDESLAASIVNNNKALQAKLPAGRTGYLDLDSGMQEVLKTEELYPVHDPIHPSEEGYRVMGHIIAQQLFF